jgi:hypothetical protein
MSTQKQAPMERLKYHVSGAIERGEAKAIVAVVAKTMACKDYLDSVDYHRIDTWVDECYYDGGMTSKDMENMFNTLVKEAKEQGITLVDEADFDYENYFENVYDCAEKGLS